MSNGIPCGGTTVFARGGVIAEAHERQHFRVDLVQIASGGREVNLLSLVNPATIFNALRDRGLVFSGPAPLDIAARCMRFMFEKDARAFYEAFKEMTRGSRVS